MQTQTFIAPSATITRVTELTKGNTYKRLVDNSFSSDDKMVYGVVTDVLNNGTAIAIQTIEFEPDYANRIEIKHRVFKGERDLAIFPAEPNEIRSYYLDAIDASARNVKTKEQDLSKAQQEHATLKAFTEGRVTEQLTAPVTTNVIERLDVEEGKNEVSVPFNTDEPF